MTCDLLNHMKVIHGFDFVGHRTELGLNFYQQVSKHLSNQPFFETLPAF